MIADLIPIIEKTMEEHNVRAFSGEVQRDAFGTEYISIRGHFNDLRFCNWDKMCAALRLACRADVGSGPGTNDIFIRPFAEDRPGTVPYRFKWLMQELDKRFPEGAKHRMFCGEPPESHLLREIDAYMAQHRSDDGK